MSSKYPTSRRVLDYIREYYAEHKIPPTMIEICNGAGLKSTSNTYYHIVRLAEDGYIDRMKGVARGAVPTEKEINQLDFMQYRPKARPIDTQHKPKLNPNDPYGGDYGTHSTSVRQSKQVSQARRNHRHK